MSNNKLHGHPLSASFTGDFVSASFFSNGRTDSSYGTQNFSMVSIENVPYATVNNGPGAAFLWQYKPSGIISGSAIDNPYHGPISKPPTVAFMWILRYR